VSQNSRAASPNGSEAAAGLEQLFEDAYDRILGYCVVRTGSVNLAEDIVSATFVDAARRVAGPDGPAVDVPWLYMVARRRLVDHWRSAERHRNRIRRIIEWRAADGRVEFEGDPTPHLVQRALASLPERQRALLTLRYLDDCSVAEIADELGLTYRAAESALARARKSFATSWKELQ
jgi:RNA polymerase sigma-70 factor (ECF subfamily)